MTVLDHLREIIKQEHLKTNHLDEKALDVPFKELGLDSLDLFQVIVALEKRLNVTLNDEVLMSLKTVNDLISAIQKLDPKL
ncbi:phosphopantetheine-binding protein [[Mycoplasma] testudinis]|uniref:phosphopantetheine-binding protein n=1 Tax=[Mycoplasma] testudinis TaxID=33924 RepID=UPI000489194C|nr:phosphopantetheine-binding protein [[Mycoplasma] testudinis]